MSIKTLHLKLNRFPVVKQDRDLLRNESGKLAGTWLSANEYNYGRVNRNCQCQSQPVLRVLCILNEIKWNKMK